MAAQYDLTARRRLVGLYWFLNLLGLVLIAIAARFMFHKSYPLDPGVLYPLLYLQALVLALGLGAIGALIKAMAKQSPRP